MKNETSWENTSVQAKPAFCLPSCKVNARDTLTCCHRHDDAMASGHQVLRNDANTMRALCVARFVVIVSLRGHSYTLRVELTNLERASCLVCNL